MRERQVTVAPARRDHDVIRRTAELLASDVSLREVFSQFCRLLARVIDASRVFVALREGETLRIVYMLSGNSVGDPEDADIREGSLSAMVATSGQSVLKRTAEDWDAPRVITRMAGAPDGLEVVSAIYVPLKFGPDVIGVLSVQSAVENAYGEDDVELLETCALYLAVRVHDARQVSANRALAGLAASDGLTGIPNRRTFDERLTQEWNRCAESGAPFAIVFVDVDYFKVFNDRYGHLAGDACLQQVARAMAACVKRTNDMLARYGGEEFAAILPSTSGADAIKIAENMRAAVAAMAIDHDGTSLGRVSISVGVAVENAAPGADPMSVVKLADEAAYRAKAGGRNRVVGPDGYVSTAPAALRRQPTRHNLQMQLTRFLGRERELGEIRQILDEARLVTLSGPGGIGKTRLAVEAARTMVTSFADGVWQIDLARLEDPALLPGAVAAALELDASEAATSVQLIVAALKSKTVLLVFDNCEHLTDACASLVETLLVEAPNVRVIATSREPLGIGGERVYRVASLALPVIEGRVGAEQVRGYDGVRFFVARAEEAADFVLDDENATVVAHICRRLDGIPLAIELATARLRAMTVDELAERLDESFRILAGGSRAALPRQQTLRTLIDWSYKLLSEGEKSVFARLAVFAGSWTLDAATFVCSTDDVSAASLVENLTQLVDKSLVLMEPHGAHNRYHFLESTREYARERLSAGGEAAEIQKRYVEYYRLLAERACAGPGERPTRSWLPPLIPEWDNLRNVLTWCLYDGGDRIAGASIAADLVAYWEAVSKPGDALTWLEAAISAPGLPEALVARVELGIAFFLRLTSDDPERAAALSRRALDTASANGDDAGRCVALINLAGAFLMQNGTEEAVPMFEEALVLARANGDLLSESDALNNLAICADYHGHMERSRPLYEQSLAIARTLGHDRKTARALHNLCALTQDLGDLDQAVRYEREAVAILERYGTPRQFLIDLADLELIRGNLAAADRICRDILEGLVFERSMWLVRECMFVFAQVHARAGHDDRAARLVGFMETLDARLAPRQPTFEELYARFVADLMERLSGDTYMHGYRDGSALTLDDAVREALQPL